MTHKSITLHMIFMASIMVNFFKLCFGFSFVVSLGSTIESLTQTPTDNFFSTILEAVPSKIVVVLGTAYGVLIVAKKVDELYHTYKMNLIRRRERYEDLERSEMETENMRNSKKNEE